MATIGFPRYKTRPSYLGQVFAAYPHHGTMVAQKWPKKRGRTRILDQRAQLDWLAGTGYYWKNGDPLYTQQLTQHAGDLLMRPRDYYTHLTSGRRWYVIETDGHKLFSLKFTWIVSTALDILACASAALLVRGIDEWRPLPGGHTGARLVMHAGFPAWSDGTEVSMTEPSTPQTAGISDSLDAIAQTPGSLIFRDSDYWTEIPPGSEGQVLTIGADGRPAWATPAP